MMLPAHKEQIPIPLAQLSKSSHSARRFAPFFIFSAVLLILFSKPILDLAKFAFQESFYSHLLLIPFISAYLIQQRVDLHFTPRRGSLMIAGGLFAVGVLLLASAIGLNVGSHSLNDYLSLTVLSFVSFFIAGCEFFLGRTFCRVAAFPLFFLFFLAPFPEAFTDFLEIAFQQASAEAYTWLMDLSRATYFRQGLVFALPNLTIRIAQECSGIRSSLVLFITSLIAGFLFLGSPWRRAVFSFLVIPVGIFRNAIRIYFLSMASVYWNPNIIHSPLHHRGGPIFFALSLIPLFLLLWWFRRKEFRKTSL
jgi:exosortase C (VPDSG-CTERM-specific)